MHGNLEAIIFNPIASTIYMVEVHGCEVDALALLSSGLELLAFWVSMVTQYKIYSLCNHDNQ